MKPTQGRTVHKTQAASLMFQRTHSTVLKRVRGPLVGNKSVLNFLTAGPEGGVLYPLTTDTADSAL
jgi:hypothetical protein